MRGKGRERRDGARKTGGAVAPLCVCACVCVCMCMCVHSQLTPSIRSTALVAATSAFVAEEDDALRSTPGDASSSGSRKRRLSIWEGAREEEGKRREYVCVCVCV